MLKGIGSTLCRASVHALCTSAFVVVVSLVVAGCSSSSPRFRTAETTPERVIQEDDEFKFASKIKDEETREDDKKIDLTNIQKRLAQRPRPTTSYSNITPKSLNRDQVLLDVVSFLGTPYAFGGSSKNGIDCSGLTSHVYAAAANKKLPRSTREQFQVGAEVPKDDLQFGDLVFFSTTGSKPSHVGIYIEDDLFAHASVSYGVTFSSLESSYYKKRFVGARRVAE